jgi:putative protein-disulfide isomerase
MSESTAKVQILHFADPWCFWSWGLEPLLQRLRAVYGENLQVIYRMGGMADDFRQWQLTYRVDDDGTAQWIRQAMGQSGHPQNPDFMVHGELESSYPSCKAFKAAEMQSAHKAETYFRRLMEVFQIEAKSPTEEQFLAVAKEIGLDPDRMADDLHSQVVEDVFLEDKHAMQTMRVNFLSLVIVVGKKYSTAQGTFQAGPIERAIDRLLPGLPKKQPKNIITYLDHMQGHLVHAREIAEVFAISDADAASRLEGLHSAGLVGKQDFHFGTFWIPKAGFAEADHPDAAIIP